jgi:predicted O-methyltransferase YrrM
MTLAELYRERLHQNSDIVQHLPTLYDTVVEMDAKVVVELGVRGGASTAAFLAAVEQTGGHLWSVDIIYPGVPDEFTYSDLWTLLVGDDMDPAVTAELPQTVDVLFIDTSHHYDHTLAELRLYTPRVRPGGRVLLHDTELDHPDGYHGAPFPVANALTRGGATVTITNTLYCTDTLFKAYIKETASGGDNVRSTQAITAATQAINAHCRRTFSNDDAASARVFPVATRWLAYVDDFHTTTGLVVKTDDLDDGTFSTTWVAADYELHPLNGISAGISGFPYCKLRAASTREFPVCTRRVGTLQVTAKWGWAAVPNNVFQACLILAHEFWKLADAPFGVTDVGNWGPMRVRDNPRVSKLLEPFVRDDRAVLVA